MIIEDRILLLALRGRDAMVAAQLLERSGHRCVVCSSLETLADEMRLGAGAVLVTEESLDGETQVLLDVLADQPLWSDFPFILLATKRAGRRTSASQHLLEALGNLIVLERPLHSETLNRAITSALRARHRQYQSRRYLGDLQQAEAELRVVNDSLEQRIAERTEELRRAHDLLVQEIAERERAEAALLQSKKMEALGQLTGGIAHDFNNLLTIIVGNLELIRRRAPDEKLAALADYGLQASERAVKLTGQLLSFSRVDKVLPRPVEVNVLVGGLHELLPHTIGPEHQIDVQLAPEAPWAMADDSQLELAILNLALNARDATPGGGKLSISVTCARADGLALSEGPYVVVGVSDDGVGVPEDLIEKVFDPFFTTKPPGKGTGLGLSQVYGIARQFGGTARIFNRQGGGCTVEIWLPRVSAPQDTVAANPSPSPQQIGVGRRVLVVEDDEGVRRYLSDCLTSLGFDVLPTASGAEGLARLQGFAAQLIIADYAMPGMNGVEFIKAVRKRTPTLPIVLATGYADMEAVNGVIPGDHVLRKPFQISELVEAITRAAPANSGTGPP
jgi:signal transduction histidine kinase/ActR/RegA family two-component response regulator